MSSPLQLHLLRRTLAALAVASGLGFAVEAAAQGTVTLTGASGPSCSYSAMSITPNGNVNVTCGTTQPPPPPPPPPPAGTFSLSPATLNAAPSSNATLTITRNNIPSGSYNVYWELSGTGCAASQPMPAVVTFVDGGPATINILVGVSATIGNTCTAKVHVVEPLGGAAAASPASGQNVSTITVANVTQPPPPPPPTGCPTGFVAPEDMVVAQFGGQGNLKTQLLKSGQVVSFEVPNVGGNWSSSTLTMSEIANSPQPVTIEMSVNTCAGMIEADTGTNACHLKTQFGHNNKVQLLTKPYGGLNENTPPATLYSYGLCWAGTTNKKYYLNVRWTYPVCQWGTGACGYNFQYNPGPY